MSLGETLIEVHHKCGEPTLWEQRVEELSLRDDEGRWFHRTRTVEEWIYDLGTNRLMQILDFHNGTLVKIRSGSYGQGAASSPGDRVGIISVGQSKSQVILKWGQPTTQDQRQEERSFYGPRGEVVQQTVTVDTLLYDFGPNRLVRVLTFENGKLTDNRTRGYGRERPSDPAGEPENTR